MSFQDEVCSVGFLPMGLGPGPARIWKRVCPGYCPSLRLPSGVGLANAALIAVMAAGHSSWPAAQRLSQHEAGHQPQLHPLRPSPLRGSTGQTQPTVYRAPASLVCVKRSWGSRLLQSDLRGKLLPPGSQASLRIIRLSTAQMVRNPPAMRETWVPSLGWEDLLEKGMATHSSILT